MLRPCTRCRRPIREPTCPFCGGARSVSQVGTRSVPARLVAAHAAIVVAGIVSESCSSSAVPFYGSPCVGDCGFDASADTSEPAFPDVGISDAPVDAVDAADSSDGSGDASDGGPD